MSGPSVSFRGPVAVLHLGDDENRFARDFLDVLEAALDEALARSETGALVTAGSARFYCNGYDLDWLASQNRDARRAFIRDQQRLLGRLLAFPLPTVAAISGHAFGAGALLALAHDFRLLRADGAAVCMPEIDARIPLRRAMWALLETRLGPTALRDVVLTGGRFAGPSAVEVGLVHEVAPADVLLARAVEVAGRRAGKERETLGRLKYEAYRDAVRGLAGEGDARSA